MFGNIIKIIKLKFSKKKSVNPKQISSDEIINALFEQVDNSYNELVKINFKSGKLYSLGLFFSSLGILIGILKAKEYLSKNYESKIFWCESWDDSQVDEVVKNVKKHYKKKISNIKLAVKTKKIL